MPATSNGQVNIKVGFTVDKTSLEEIQRALSNITKTSELDRLNNAEYKTSEAFQRAGESAQKLKTIVSTSWNNQLNQLDLSRFQQQMEASNLSLTQFKDDCYAMGATGATSFNTLASSIFSTNVQIKESNKFLNSMADTLSKTLKWTVASTAIRKISGSVQEAWGFTKELDASLNDIRIVTGKSAEEMASFAVQANEAAKALGATTVDYTNASLIFYQQGLDDEEVQARTEVVTKVANVTGQAASEVADNLTAVWNGYQITAEQAEESIDILAAVAANTASNLEELSTGMTKVAAAANEMGVGEAQLASQISTIVSATRQAPETVGQALKTVYARMSTINAGGEDEDDGATLTSYSEKMAKFGVEVLDTNGHLRDMGDVIEEIGGKWENFSRETQISLAQAMAGTRQYVNVMALFENWDQYEKTLEIANDSLGTLQTQQDTYMESTAAHLQQMSASAETLYMNLFDTSTINKFIDALSWIIDRFSGFTESLGGGMQSIVNYALIIGNIFSNQIANGIAKAATNQELMKDNTATLQYLTQEANALLNDQQEIIKREGESEQDYIHAVAQEKGLREQLEGIQSIEAILPSVSSQDVNNLININSEMSKLIAETEELEQQQNLNTNKERSIDYYETEIRKQEELLEIRKNGFNSLVFQQTLLDANINKTQQQTAVEKESVVTKEEEVAAVENINTTLENTKIITEEVNEKNKELVKSEEEIKETKEGEANASKNQVSIEEQLLALEKEKVQVQQSIDSINNDKTLGIWTPHQDNELIQNEAKLEQINKDIVALKKEQGEVEADQIYRTADRELIERAINSLKSEREALDEKQLKMLEDTLTLLKKTNLTEKESNTLTQNLTEAQKIANQTARAHKETIEELNKGLHNTEALDNRQIETNKAKLAQLKAQKDALLDQKNLAQEISGLISGISTLMVSITQIWNTFKLWTDDDVTISQKIEQSITSIAFTIPMIITSVQRLSKAYKALQNQIKMTQMAQAVNSANGVLALSGSVGLLGGLVAFLPEILAIAAAVAAIAVAAKQAYDWFHQYAYEADQAAQAADHLADASDRVAESLNNIQSKINTYDNAKNTLDDCIKGTQDWYDALSDVNDAAKDIIQTIKDLNGAGLTSGEISGLYNASTGEINQDTLDKVIAQQTAKSTTVALASAEADYEAELKSLKVDLHNDILDTVNTRTSQDINGRTATEILFEHLNEFVGLTEENAKARAAELLGIEKTTDGLEDLVPEILDLAQQADAAAASLSAISSIEFAEYFEGEDLADDYTFIMSQLYNQQSQETSNQLRTILENTAGVVSTPNDDLTIDLLNNLLGSDLDLEKAHFNRFSTRNNDVYQAILDFLNDNGYNYKETNKNPITFSTKEGYQFYFEDENGEKTEGINFNEIATLVGATEASKTLEETADETIQIVDAIDQALNIDFLNINNSFQGFLASIKGQNLEEVSQSSVEGLSNYFTMIIGELKSDKTVFNDIMNYQKTGEISGELAQAMRDKIIQDIADAEAEMLNITDTDSEEYKNLFNQVESIIPDNFVTSTEQKIQDYEIALEDIPNGLRSITKELYGAFYDDKDLSVNARIGITSLLNEAINAGLADVDEEGAITGVAADLAGVFTDLDGEIADDLLAVSDSIEWGHVTIDDFINSCEAADITLNLTDAEINTFVDSMNELANASISATEKLAESYSELHKIIDGLSFRDTISEDDYNTLMQQTEGAAAQYFSYMLDGTYALTGNAKDFYNLVQNQLIQQAYDQIAANQEQQQKYADYAKIYTDENGKENSINLNAVNAFENAVNAFNSNLINNNNAREQLQQQLDFIEAFGERFGDITVETWGNWQDAVDEGTELTQDDLNEIAETAESVYNLMEENGGIAQACADEIESLAIENYELILAIGLSYDSLQDLKEALDEGTISTESFNAAFSTLYEEQRTEGLDTDNIEGYAKYLQKLSKETEGWADTNEMSLDTARSLATQIMRMNNAVDDLADNLEDWSDILQNSTEMSYEYWEALDGVNGALADLLDMTEDAFSATFAINNLELLQEAATGSEDAIDALRQNALEDIALNITLDVKEDSQIQTNEELLAWCQDMQMQLDDLSLDVGIGVDLTQLMEGKDSLIDACNNMILEAGLTADEVNNLFSGMGYDVTFAEKPQEVTTSIPHYMEHYKIIEQEPIHMNAGQINAYDIPQYDVEHWTETIDYDTQTTTVNTAAMATSEPGTTVIPKINTISKKASGVANNYSSKNAGGKSPGSSSSSSTPTVQEPSHEDYIEDQADRYHDIDLRLQDISTSLSRLQKQESKLFGQALINNLNEQLATLDDLIDATQEKIKIATQEASELRAELSSQGVRFDSEGNITNYASAMASQLSYVNNIVDKYNAMSAEEQEAYQDTLDAAEESYEDFVDKLNNYDTLIHDTIPGLEDDITDALDQEIEIQISKFTMEVEIRLNMQQAETDWNEFYRKVILGLSDDDLVGNALQDYLDFRSYLNTDNTGIGSIQALTEQVNDTIDQINQYNSTGWMSVYGDDINQALDDLQTYYSQLFSDLEDLQDLQDDVWDTYLSAIDKVIDAFDDHINQYEFLDQQLNHDLNLIELIYGPEAYGMMDNYYQQIYANDLSRLSTLKSQADYYEHMMDTATSQEDYEKWRDAWEEAIKDINSLSEECIKTIAKMFENTLDSITKEFENIITNGLGLDWISEEWDLINMQSDIYLDTVNSIYQVEKLQQKYLDAIDNTDSVSAQKRLNELMEEQIGYLQDKENLTQYDIDRAELLYEIELKRIALEEAQQNKSNMRLRRDSQGNYTYQYVADENEISSLQQDILDLQNQLYNLDVDNYKENLQKMIDATEECEQKLTDLWIAYYENEEMTEEEYLERREALIDTYTRTVESYAKNAATAEQWLNDDTFDHLAGLYAEDPQLFLNMLDDETAELLGFTRDSEGIWETSDGTIQGDWQSLVDDMKYRLGELSEADQKAIMEEMVPVTASGAADMAGSISDAAREGTSALDDAARQWIKDADEAGQNYRDQIDQTLNAGGIAASDLENGNDRVASKTREVIDAARQEAEQWVETCNAVREYCDMLNQLVSIYQDVINAGKEAASSGYEVWQSTNAAAASAASSNKTSSSSASSGSNSSSSSSSSLSNTQGNGYIEVGDKVTLTTTGYWERNTGTGKYGTRYEGQSLYVTKTVTDTGENFPVHLSTKPVNPSTPANDYQVGWVQPWQISGYDTGGYTGEWQDENNNGALAFLHQKELVLNQQDTQNLLAAVGIVRNISSLLNNLNTNIYQRKYEDALTSLNQMATMIKDMMQQGEVLEQDVHIDATFPNVSDSREIEEAFNNLVNVAAQRAAETKDRYNTYVNAMYR